MVEYKLIRTNRKTMAIYVTKDATVEVRAPLKLSKASIDRFVLAKDEWIKKHLSIKEQNILQKTGFSLTYGDMVLLQGKEHPIREKEGNRIGFDGECFYMPPNLNSDEIKQALIQVYKLAAKRILTQKVIHFAERMHVSPTAIKINSAKTRWGSCSGKNSINFSWLLIMASDSVIDYVVIHELAHIKEHNHSKNFWAIVKAVMPDYKERQQGLEVLQKRLNKEHWG